MKRIVFSLLVITGFLTTTSLHAQLQITELHRVVPNGAKQGAELELTVGGAFNDDLTRMVFNHPGITAEQKVNPAGEFDAAPVPVNGTFLVKMHRKFQPVPMKCESWGGTWRIKFSPIPGEY